MNMDLDLIIQTAKSATRNIERDYLELLKLQSSRSGTEKFAQNAIDRLKYRLEQKLEKYFSKIIISTTFNLNEIDNFSINEIEEMAILIHPMEGLQNFRRALSFFSIPMAILKREGSKIIIEQAIMYFPALDSVHYVTRGQGTFVETYRNNIQAKIRTRVSSVSNLGSAVIGTNLSNLPFARELSDNIRIFDSDSYNISLLISGNIDVAILSNRSLFPIMRTFIEAAGGFITEQNGIIVASNSLLHDKILSSRSKE